MGIKGLHKYLASITKNKKLRQLSGCKAAVDANCWLHRGIFCCISDIFHEKPTTAYLKFCQKMLQLLITNKITPIVVFDGIAFPFKSETNNKRTNDRIESREKALKLIRKGLKREAYEFMRRAVSVNFEMTRELIKLCMAMEIDYIVAPYEADSQIAYLYKTGLVDFAISEDSDLLAFGCSKVMFKLDDSGDGDFVDMDKAPQIFKDGYNSTKFLKMCILSGCDYLPSLPGIGIVRAAAIIFGSSKVPKSTISREIALQITSSFPKYTQEQISEYSKEFSTVFHAFFYQPVFDAKTGTMTNLNPPSDTPECLRIKEQCNISDAFARSICMGNVDTKTGNMVKKEDLILLSSISRTNSLWSALSDVPDVFSHSPVVKRRVSKYFKGEASPKIESQKRKRSNLKDINL